MNTGKENLSCAICGYFCDNYHHHNNWFDTTKPIVPPTPQAVEQPAGEQGEDLGIAVHLSKTRNKPFFIDTFRTLLNQFHRGEISMSKFVETLNIIAYKWAAPTAPASSVEQRAKEYADNVCPYEWPKNKEGEPVTAVPGQTGAPGSGKHRKLQNKIIAAFLAGHSSQQPTDAVTLTREQLDEVIEQGIKIVMDSAFVSEKGEILYSGMETDRDKETYISSLFKQRGK